MVPPLKVKVLPPVISKTPAPPAEAVHVPASMLREPPDNVTVLVVVSAPEVVICRDPPEMVRVAIELVAVTLRTGCVPVPLITTSSPVAGMTSPTQFVAVFQALEVCPSHVIVAA